LNPIGADFSGPLHLPLSNRLLQMEKATDAAPSSFQELLANGVLQVNSMQQEANTQIHALLTGEDVNQTEVYTAVQKADMAFRMLVQIRNKLLSAYEEINNIRI
jgi:flagellar hook-basal body complex protein FliE